MSMIRNCVRVSAAFALVGVTMSCDHDAEVLGIPAPVDDMFLSYVAIGNSITAGLQSGGIDSLSQSQSFANLLARQMRTRFAFPALAATGCPARIINWQTTARPTGAPPCALRNAALATHTLNNVAVPDAGTTEVNAQGTTTPAPPYHNTLTSLFLGGKTQIQRALEARPTFASIWIGNNDALAAATVGQIGGNPAFAARPLTSQANFEARYNEMIAALQAGAPDVQGVLLGVVQVPNAPRFFPVAAFQNAAFLAGFSALAQGAVTVHPNCTSAPGASAMVSFEILRVMQAGLHPRTIACGATGVMLPYGQLGDVFILETSEQTALATAIQGYNDYIAAKANEIGFAYYDPNATLSAQRIAGGCVALVPDLAAPVAGSPFGSCVSNDGVHPSAAGQRLIANGLIGAINQEYGTTIPAVP
jgi:lysophospholipase L1-like esterase